MHETYRILAEDRIEEHMREADAWRLAREGLPSVRRPGLAARMLALISRAVAQRRRPGRDRFCAGGRRSLPVLIGRRIGRPGCQRLGDEADALHDLAFGDGAVAEDQPPGLA